MPPPPPPPPRCPARYCPTADEVLSCVELLCHYGIWCTATDMASSRQYFYFNPESGAPVPSESTYWDLRTAVMADYPWFRAQLVSVMDNNPNDKRALPATVAEAAERSRTGSPLRQSSYEREGSMRGRLSPCRQNSSSQLTTGTNGTNGTTPRVRGFYHIDPATLGNSTSVNNNSTINNNSITNNNNNNTPNLTPHPSSGALLSPTRHTSSLNWSISDPNAKSINNNNNNNNNLGTSVERNSIIRSGSTAGSTASNSRLHTRPFHAFPQLKSANIFNTVTPKKETSKRRRRNGNTSPTRQQQLHTPGNTSNNINNNNNTSGECMTESVRDDDLQSPTTRAIIGLYLKHNPTTEGVPSNDEGEGGAQDPMIVIHNLLTRYQDKRPQLLAFLRRKYNDYEFAGPDLHREKKSSPSPTRLQPSQILAPEDACDFQQAATPLDQPSRNNINNNSSMNFSASGSEYSPSVRQRRVLQLAAPQEQTQQQQQHISPALTEVEGQQQTTSPTRMNSPKRAGSKSNNPLPEGYDTHWSRKKAVTPPLVTTTSAMLAAAARNSGGSPRRSHSPTSQSQLQIQQQPQQQMSLSQSQLSHQYHHHLGEAGEASPSAVNRVTREVAALMARERLLEKRYGTAIRKTATELKSISPPSPHQQQLQLERENETDMEVLQMSGAETDDSVRSIGERPLATDQQQQQQSTQKPKSPSAKALKEHPGSLMLDPMANQARRVGAYRLGRGQAVSAALAQNASAHKNRATSRSNSANAPKTATTPKSPVATGGGNNDKRTSPKRRETDENATGRVRSPRRDVPPGPNSDGRLKSPVRRSPLHAFPSGSGYGSDVACCYVVEEPRNTRPEGSARWSPPRSPRSPRSPVTTMPTNNKNKSSSRERKNRESGVSNISPPATAPAAESRRSRSREVTNPHPVQRNPPSPRNTATNTTTTTTSTISPTPATTAAAAVAPVDATNTNRASSAFRAGSCEEVEVEVEELSPDMAVPKPQPQAQAQSQPQPESQPQTQSPRESPKRTQPQPRQSPPQPLNQPRWDSSPLLSPRKTKSGITPRERPPTPTLNNTGNANTAAQASTSANKTSPVTGSSKKATGAGCSPNNARSTARNNTSSVVPTTPNGRRSAGGSSSPNHNTHVVTPNRSTRATSGAAASPSGNRATSGGRGRATTATSSSHNTATASPNNRKTAGALVPAEESGALLQERSKLRDAIDEEYAELRRLQLETAELRVKKAATLALLGLN